jgi:hypothetical protein
MTGKKIRMRKPNIPSFSYSVFSLCELRGLCGSYYFFLFKVYSEIARRASFSGEGGNGERAARAWST